MGLTDQAIQRTYSSTRGPEYRMRRIVPMASENWAKSYARCHARRCARVRTSSHMLRLFVLLAEAAAPLGTLLGNLRTAQFDPIWFAVSPEGGRMVPEQEQGET